MKNLHPTANTQANLKTSQAPSRRGAKHAETAALLAKITAQQGLLFYFIFD
jgi:hypothetical protein